MSAEEYYTILKAHGVDCTKEEIVQMMQIADKDHDGLVFISFDRYLKSLVEIDEQL